MLNSKIEYISRKKGNRVFKILVFIDRLTPNYQSFLAIQFAEVNGLTFASAFYPYNVKIEKIIVHAS